MASQYRSETHGGLNRVILSRLLNCFDGVTSAEARIILV